MKLILCLIAIESGGNDMAVGDSGKAHGALQIHQICVDDVNRIYGTSYTIQDAYKRDEAIEICKLYLMYWGSEERLGRKATYEDLARIWNGGPNGYKKESTIGYWKKVEKLL